MIEAINYIDSSAINFHRIFILFIVFFIDNLGVGWISML